MYPQIQKLLLGHETDNMTFPLATEREKVVSLARKVTTIREAEEKAGSLLRKLDDVSRLVWEAKMVQLRGSREYRDFLGNLQAEIQTE